MLGKEKIGIVTLFGYHNYGNRLQMYAVQQVYKHLGFPSEIIKYKLEGSKDPLIIQVKVGVMYLLFLRTNLKKYFAETRRIANFKKHAKKNYSETKHFVDPLKIPQEFSTKYAFFSAGSDQIWGWFTHPIAPFVFLNFAPREKRITFSPSFGSADINEKYRRIFTEGLEGFDKISVREQSGADMVKDFTAKDATVLCDPTMCLSKEDWLNFSAVHKKKPKKKYILTYFLGAPSPKAAEILKQFSAEFQIVQLNSLQSPEFYAVNPSEWVDFIHNASLFLTDSFHGIVFSIILQTPFAVYSRKGGEDMQTRISHILEKFRLEDRFEMSSGHSSLFKIDFSNREILIETEKSKAYNFLKYSLNK